MNFRLELTYHEKTIPVNKMAVNRFEGSAAFGDVVQRNSSTTVDIGPIYYGKASRELLGLAYHQTTSVRVQSR